MKIKEHFSKMFVSLGWVTTGCVMLYGIVFTISQLWLCMGK